jgi:hypothetical protein
MRYKLEPVTVKARSYNVHTKNYISSMVKSFPSTPDNYSDGEKSQVLEHNTHYYGCRHLVIGQHPEKT